LWQDNSTDSVYNVEYPGIYSLIANRGSCKVADTVSIRFDKPVFLELGNDTIICETDVLVLSATNPDAVYLWQDSSKDSVFPVSRKGTYHVTVTNSCGMVSDGITIDYENCSCFFIPNSFTPNKDGINEVFSAFSRCDLADYKLNIYNRWGEIIFKSENTEGYWDGRFRGIECAEGIYIYEITYALKNRPTEHRNGHVSLIR
jgi:gliding motility-associated-like protein